MRSTPAPKAPKAQPAGFDTIKKVATHIAAHKGSSVMAALNNALLISQFDGFNEESIRISSHKFVYISFKHSHKQYMATNAHPTHPTNNANSPQSVDVITAAASNPLEP